MGLITVEEMARRLNITPRAAREWLKKGIIPGIKLGRIWRIDEKDLEEFIRKAKDKR